MRKWIATAGVLGCVAAGCATGEVDATVGTTQPTVDAGDGQDDGGTLPGEDAGSTFDAAPKVDAGTADAAPKVDAGGTSDAAPEAAPKVDAGPPDTGTPDVGSDAPVVVDAGPPDTGAPDTGTPEAGTCAPGDVSSFSPTWHAPGTHVGACTSSDIDAFWTACMDPAGTQATCDAFTSSKGTCFNCLATNSTASKWGPLVLFGASGVALNVGGCVDASGGSSTCSHATQGDLQCVHSACDPSCGSATDAEYASCVSAADGAGCKTYADTENSQCALLTGAAASCFDGTTFQAGFKAIAPTFCGP